MAQTWPMPVVIRKTPRAATMTPRTARLRACTQSVHARHRSAGPCGRRQLADKWQFGKRQSHELLRRGRAELGAQSGPEARITVSAVKYRKSVVIPTPTRKVIHGGPACNASRARVDNRENAVGPAWHDGSSAGIAGDPTPGRSASHQQARHLRR